MSARPKLVLEGAVATTWPKPARRDAFVGVLGDFIEEVRHHTEADPHSILLHALVMFGNVVGRGPHFDVGATRHGLNLFALVVGGTAASRKGSGSDQAYRLMRVADVKWPPYITGLSSGEGLIHQVRDPHEIPAKGKGKPLRDPGVSDKRLLVLEPEFASLLQVMGRNGNTVSSVTRQAFDGHTLQVASRTTAARATDPHISIIGHVTQDELMNLLGHTNAVNGFINRFLLAMARRSNRLPDGGNLSAVRLGTFQRRVQAAARFAKGVTRMTRTSHASDLWKLHYDRLTDGAPGLVGAVTSRAAPLVMRLACVYALLDESAVVKETHLTAALALWDYCEASAKHLFGGRTGSTDADRILQALRKARPDGLSRDDIYRRVFQKHKSREEIRTALSALMNQGVAVPTTRKTAGRSEERWCAV